jgi:hypothetical protein
MSFPISAEFKALSIKLVLTICPTQTPTQSILSLVVFDDVIVEDEFSKELFIEAVHPVPLETKNKFSTLLAHHILISQLLTVFINHSKSITVAVEERVKIQVQIQLIGLKLKGILHHVILPTCGFHCVRNIF